MSKVRAKFKVASKEGNGNNGFVITLEAVRGGSPENDKFFNLTPNGSVYLQTINAEAAEAFNVGDEIYVDFKPVQQNPGLTIIKGENTETGAVSYVCVGEEAPNITGSTGDKGEATQMSQADAQAIIDSVVAEYGEDGAGELFAKDGETEAADWKVTIEPAA